MTSRQQMGSTLGGSLSEEAEAARCEACGSSGLVPFYEARSIPTQTCVLLDSREAARTFPVGELSLGFCEGCGFIQNMRFKPELVDYSKPMEESQAFSPRFNEFASWLADELMDRLDLKGQTVLEVGCGKGDFLRLLAERGVGQSVGIDPGFLPNRIELHGSTVDFLREWYGPEHTHLTGQLVLTRHLMEHVSKVAEFFGWLRDSVSRTSGAVLFTEVPDTSRVLSEGAFWDIYYEHCSYFTMGSLARALNTAGFEVKWMQRGFDDQYLLSAARPSDKVDPADIGESVTQIASLVDIFSRRAAAKVREWHDLVSSKLESGARVALWGGGSKAVAFLSAIQVDDVTVVDINPHKQGKWLPGIGAKVEAPASLVQVDPALVIVMNAIYVPEIETHLRQMGLSPLVLAL